MIHSFILRIFLTDNIFYFHKSASSVLAPFLFRCFKKNEDYEENEIGATDANGIEMNQVNLTREK